jgi:group I intron endonuclease
MHATTVAIHYCLVAALFVLLCLSRAAHILKPHIKLTKYGLKRNSKYQYTTAMTARVPLSYANGKIYKIVNDVNDFLYIGSTTQALSKRMAQHRSDGKTLKARRCKVHLAMNAIGIHHFSIILIEAFSCASKDALEAREYVITNAYDKTKLYNDKFNNIISEDVRAKLSATQKITMPRGDKHYFFTRGSIYPKRLGSFVYSWQINGVQHTKSYCFAKEGSRELAYLKCVDLRNATFPHTTEDYSKELPFFED